jgi:hypothetical protein
MGTVRGYAYLTTSLCRAEVQFYEKKEGAHCFAECEEIYREYIGSYTTNSQKT